MIIIIGIFKLILVKLSKEFYKHGLIDDIDDIFKFEFVDINEMYA